MRVQAGAHKRKPNDILGALCRELFPGLMMHAGVLGLAYMWDLHHRPRCRRSGREVFRQQGEAGAGRILGKSSHYVGQKLPYI